MFEIAEYIGIIAFTMSGFFAGSRSGLDFLGLFTSVFLTTFGGGMIRDILVDRQPYVFTHMIPATLMFVLVVIMILLRVHKRESFEGHPLFVLADSIGLVSFGIAGALTALESGFNLAGVLALSFTTATGGGVLRDIIVNEVPFVFKAGFLYGTIALLAGLMIYLLTQWGMVNFYSMAAVLVLGVLLRIVAYYRDWAIPSV